MALFVRRRWPKRVAAAVVVLALMVLAAGIAFGSRDKPRGDKVVESAEPLPPEESGGPPPTPIASVLAAPKLAAYDGTKVGATSLPVLSFVSGNAVWIGESPAHRALALVVSGDKQFTVGAGDRLTFTGTVRKVTPQFAKALGLSIGDEQELLRQGAYVEVTDFSAG
jgi:hypothetical protein